MTLPQTTTDQAPAIVHAMEAIENTTALDDTIATANGVVSRIPTPVRDVLHGKPLGHPAHPVAILVPAGAWIASAVLDFFPNQQDASRILVGVGLVGALPAAATGVADWAELDQRQQRVGLVHWAANVTAIALYSASYVQRRRGRSVSGRVLAMAGLAVISGSGYIGGHLAYRQGANVLPQSQSQSQRPEPR